MKTNLTSLTADLRVGDQTQVLLKLQGDGVMPDDYAAIATNSLLRADIIAAIMKHRLFTLPEEQIKHLLEINEQVWKETSITEAAIRELGDPPDCPPSDEHGLYCVCLFYETGDAVKTFENNWQACVHIHGEDGTWKWSRLLFTPNGVKQRESAIPRKSGLRWQIAELGRLFKDQSVSDVCPQLDKALKMGMGQELPLIAALHQKWAVSMNGNNIPFVDASDLEVAPSAKGRFSDAPCLHFSRDNRRVNLNATRIDGSSPLYGSGSLQ